MSRATAILAAAALAAMTMTSMTSLVAEYCQGDTNGDGIIDIDDVVNVILDWGTDGSALAGDVDYNGVVDENDVALVVTSFGLCRGINCCAAYGGLGCEDPECESIVCGADSWCCEVEWDDLCSAAANEQCEICNSCGC